VARPGEAGAPSELEQLMATKLLAKLPPKVPANTRILFDLGRDPAWSADTLSFTELFELTRKARDLIAGARAVGPADLTVPEDRSPSGFDAAELQKRADAAATGFKEKLNALVKVDPEKAALSAVRDALLPFFYFGVPGAIPALPAGDAAADRAALAAQVPFVLKEARRRNDQHDALVAGFKRSGAPAEALVDQDLQRLRLLFGEALRVLPHVKPANASTLASALAAGADVEKKTPFAALTWFQRVSRVRAGVGRLDDSLFYAETLSTGDAPAFKILQLPVQAGEGWVGLPLPAGKTLSGGRLSIVAHAPAGLDATKPLAGLVVDDWVEVLPNATETAAVALQTSRPNATAPQAILLAVTPKSQGMWDLDTLEAVVLETLELAKLRMVDPHSVLAVGHVLPALYFAHNLQPDTIRLTTTALSP
jgi:hypothetical protein